MKLTFSFLSLLFIISVISFEAFPQEDSVKSKNSRGIFHDGSWAIQFEESRYSGFTNTTDLSVTGKKYMSSKTAICAGVSILGLLNDNKTSTVYKSYGTLYYTLDNSATSLNGTEIFVHYIYYPINAKLLNLFFGGGPAFITFTKNISQSGYIVQPNTNDHYQLSANDKVWGIGASLFLGLEWLPFKNVGITAEYGTLIITSNHSTDSYTQHSATPVPDFSSSTSNLFEVAFSDIKVGMQVYL